uniref:DNA topoisomerase 2 n=1 Tax=Sipha flava TaxID=143950 RepID=A0A2S2Q8Z8_9HEMI
MASVENGGTPPAPPRAKKTAVEEIYQKKSQLEHILLRPDTYIGSVEPVTESMWVYESEQDCMVQREITYVPGLYKIFDEILVNAADNKQRDPSMDTIKIEINQEENVISVWNNGQGIPVVEHKDEKMYVPTMIFGHLLTSSNYNDEEAKVTGGRNGYGAKLCNIFSNKFTVETASREYQKAFKQTWADNMAKSSNPAVKEVKASDYTKVTFSPDLTKFHMTCLDKDIVDLMSRRAYDIAASTRGVKVYLNKKLLPIKSFQDYVNLYIKGKEDEIGNPLKIVYENAGQRWEVAVTLSDSGFKQVSFVNSIATTKGGRHVDYVTDMIVKQLVDIVKKRNKGGMDLKNHQVKNHLWVFVNCLIVNPTFDSQTKEHMTLQVKAFGSKCTLSEKFINSVSKCGIVEAVLTWAKFKAQTQLQKQSGKKHSKLKGVPKLEDANDAGTKNSVDCTLILTEGDSAKSLAVSGLGVVGRDKYGVFPLRGKLLNVREASHKQIMENAEINNIVKIVGLQYKKKYETIEDLKTLRYGRLMIMTDQDQDGSHIKGLIINFIHHNWPSLLKLPFLEEFITPIVKASKGKEEISFYSLPEFEEWKDATRTWNKYKIKYYKGLGTSTSKEAKEYFQNMKRHRILFKYEDNNDGEHIEMAFSKKCVDARKEWLTNWMIESKRRKEAGLAEDYLYEKNTKSVTYKDFVNKELVLFSNMDNERSIASAIDGLKPGSRKVLFTCLKRNDKREIKVAQLAGSVAEHSAYHHGEMSLMSTIVNLAHNYVGSNNINLLQPIGQFGTRLQGGKDAASARYIFTMLSPLARSIFHPHDDPLLTYLRDDNQKIEPIWYMPIIPMVLVNGAEGIGTGWMTKIPNHNPREIVANLKRMMRGEEILPMKPWFKNFIGQIEKISEQKFISSGEVGIIGHNKVEITELPVGVWTQNYKESVLETMLSDTEKSPSVISDYKEYNTDTTVKFVVSMNPQKLQEVENEGIHKFFKLHSSLSLTSMCAFDKDCVLKKYESTKEILQDFYTVRLEFYGKRKAYLEGILGAEAAKLTNQARFIVEKCDGNLRIENRKKTEMIKELVRLGYNSDPVKAWKLIQDRESVMLDEAQERVAEDTEEDETAPSTSASSKDDENMDFDYLLGMSFWHLTLEKKNELLRKKEEKCTELDILKKKTPIDIWNEDLDEFLIKLEEVEEKERLDELGDEGGKTKGAKSGKLAISNKKKINLVSDSLPSPAARRIIPKIDAEMVKKEEKLIAAKGKRIERKKKGDGDAEGGEDEVKKEKKAATKKKDALKQTKLNFDKIDDGIKFENDFDDIKVLDSPPPPPRTVSKRQAGICL